MTGIMSINSSKVYCKSKIYCVINASNIGINSSKVYCKLTYIKVGLLFLIVLIVAKCIVNNENDKSVPDRAMY